MDRKANCTRLRHVALRLQSNEVSDHAAIVEFYEAIKIMRSMRNGLLARLELLSPLSTESEELIYQEIRDITVAEKQMKALLAMYLVASFKSIRNE